MDLNQRLKAKRSKLNPDMVPDIPGVMPAEFGFGPLHEEVENLLDYDETEGADAVAEAQCCDATIKRAIKSRKLDGRRAGNGHNASYEISKRSFDAWMAARGKSKREKLPSVQQPTAEPEATEPATIENISAETISKPKLTKAERRKMKAERRKVIPESARRLRRWKNFMRHADQQQALAMIKWLSARLDPKKKSLQKNRKRGT